MKIEFSFLNQTRSLVGLEISRNGHLTRNSNDEIVMKRMIQLTIGYLFGWITIAIYIGGEIKMDDINKFIREIETNKIK